MAVGNNVLSSYFKKEKAKGSKAGGASPYSAPIEVEPAGPAPGASVAKVVGSVPAGGGGGVTGAPKGSAGGGTGFVSFGQYFGANAPVIQAQAQQAVQSKAPTAQQGAASDSPYAADIAAFRAQSEALNPAAQTGYMGEGTSAFDQLLGGGVTQQAAKQEQQRLGTLRSTLEGEEKSWQKQQAARSEKQAASAAKNAKEYAYNTWAEALHPWYKENYTEEQLRQMFDEQVTPDQYAKQSEYASVSQ